MTLFQLFTAIANAIRAKKGTQSTIKAEDFPTEIAGITTGNLTNEEYEEANDDVDDILENTTVPSGTIDITESGSYDVTNYITASVTLPKVSVTSNSSNYGYFGRVARYIKQLDVEISATQLVSLFYNFNNLKSVNIKFTSAPTTMQGMFQDCSSLQKINFSNLDTSLLTNTRSMFSSCSRLQKQSLSLD